MNRLSENAIEIINTIHTNRLDFNSEYLPIMDALDSLAAYEATGLEPEVCQNYKIFEDEAISKGITFTRIVELMNAEAQGRLYMPPCKVGDTIYEPYLGRILERQVVSIVIQRSFMVIYCGGSSTCFSPADFGKIVFLTREEANRALKGESK